MAIRRAHGGLRVRGILVAVLVPLVFVYVVLVDVEDCAAFAGAPVARVAEEPALLSIITHVVPVETDFDFFSSEELEAKTGEMAPDLVATRASATTPGIKILFRQSQRQHDIGVAGDEEESSLPA